MNSIQRIAKNTAALFAAQVVVAIISLALSIFIAQKLGDVVFGKYLFALAFTTIFAMVLDMIRCGFEKLRMIFQHAQKVYYAADKIMLERKDKNDAEGIYHRNDKLTAG